MRKTIAMIIGYAGFLVAFVPTGYYVYFMWSQDWGPDGTRGRALMFALMLFGAVAVYFFTLLFFSFIATTIDKDLGK